MTGPPLVQESPPRSADRTAIVVDLEAPHVPGQNLVWSAAMGLAWNELVALAGGPIVLAGPDDAAAAIARSLNGSGVDRDVVDEASCVAHAGLQTEAFLQELRDEIARKLGDASPRYLPDEAAPDLFMAYAFLQERLAFEVPLLRASKPFQFRKSFVESFGLWRREPSDWEPRSRQVRVHHPCYTEADVERMSDAEYDVMYDEFVVELLTTEAHDRLVVAAITPGPTLAATVKRATSFLDRHGEEHPKARLGIDEMLSVPIVDLDVARRYGELYGRRADNPRLAGHQFGEVLERVRFRLDEGGALLEAEALGGGLCLPPRELLCYRPFLVMIVRRGARLPMFALWVDNDDVLVRATSNPRLGAASRVPE